MHKETRQASAKAKLSAHADRMRWHLRQLSLEAERHSAHFAMTPRGMRERWVRAR